MTRIRSLSLSLIGAAAISFAQTQQPGGWRRAADTPAPQDATPAVQADQDPSQPVARTDEYGQPRQTQPEQPPEPRQQPSVQQQGPAPPASSRPARPPYGLPPQLTVPPGTFVTVRMNEALSSDRNQEGDLFTGTLMQPVVVNGVVVAQRGQTVLGRVAEATKAARGQGTSRLALQLTGLTLADGSQVNVQSQLVNRNGRTDVNRDVGTVATTTAVGAAIGAAADWGRGAAIGGGAGAAAGIVGVLLTRGHPTVVYPETALTFRLDTPVTVDTTRAPQAYRYIGPNEYDQPVQTQIARRPPPRPYSYGPYYGPYAYPYPYGYPYPYYGGGFGVGVIIRGGHGRRW